MIEAFRPTVRVRLSGDPAAVADWAGLRALALRELEVMRRTNVHDLPVYSRTLRLDSGESIVCRRTGSLDSVDILVAPHRAHRGGSRKLPGPHPREDGYFYAIPECLARYEGLAGPENAITDGDLAGWSLGAGNDVMIVPIGDAGLPEAEGLPEAGITRERGVFVLPGGSGSGLLFGRDHIPDGAPFSVSCLVRLQAFLEYDYTYDDRDVLNPIRAYLLQSADGKTFTWDCPGSISPLLGFCSPHLHPDWSAVVTYPWAPWNADFATRMETLDGVKPAWAACDGAPRLVGDAYRDAGGAAYPYPDGLLLGLQAAGLFLYQGNRLLAARLSNFESQFDYRPAVSDPLAYGLWYHVVMTHAADGEVRLYLADAEDAAATVYAGTQPLCAMDADCLYQASGVNAWTLRNSRTQAAIGAFRQNPVMDVALPRFFHYALSPAQAYLLQLEALTGLFVADDAEAAQAAAVGLIPVTIAKEDA